MVIPALRSRLRASKGSYDSYVRGDNSIDAIVYPAVSAALYVAIADIVAYASDVSAMTVHYCYTKGVARETEYAAQHHDLRELLMAA